MSSEASKIVGLYERNAENYDKDRGRDLFERRWLADFLSLLPPGGSILDIGCGSAEPIARFFIEQGYAVTGVDSSPSLIDICTRRFPLQNWIVADMRDLCLGTGFNGIIAWDSFFTLLQKISAVCFLSSESTQPRTQLCCSPAVPLAGKQSANIEVNPYTTAVWMVRSIPNCSPTMGSQACHTS
jgi:SAM-dependent methyltransferase